MSSGVVNRNSEEGSGFRVFKQIEFEITHERQVPAEGVLIEA